MGRAIAEASSVPACPVERALALVGAKWTLIILHNLMDGPRRFGELERLVSGANPKILAARLRQLEELRLVSRTAYAEVPPRVEYALTAQGRGLRPIIDSLDRWGRQLPSSSRPRAPARGRPRARRSRAPARAVP